MSPPPSRPPSCLLAAFYRSQDSSDLLLCPQYVGCGAAHVDAPGDPDHGHVHQRDPGRGPLGLVRGDGGEQRGRHLADEQGVAGDHHGPAAVAVDDHRLPVRDVLDDVGEQDLRPKLVRGVGTQPGQDRLPGPLDVGEVGAVHLEHAELALHVQDPGLDGRHRAQGQVGYPLDRERRSHLDDQRVLTLERRIAPGPGGRAQIRGELPLQIPDEQVDAQFRGCPPAGSWWDHAYSLRIVKCLPSSVCGRGMTCTDTSSPTLVAVSAPASVAALTAPTSPMIVTATRPSPTWSRPTIVTFAAFTIASAAASAATYPFVSIMPIALSAISCLSSSSGLPRVCRGKARRSSR